MKLYNLILITVSLCCISTDFQAQIGDRTIGEFLDYNNIKMPDSPVPQGFEIFGETEVNMATGTPKITIPLYVFQLDEVKLPISLNYNASGVKVEQMASAVGLGWSLESGGEIRRSVRGWPDGNPGDWGWYVYGFLTDDYYNDNNDPNNEMWQRTMKGAAWGDGTDGLANKVDHNPDSFSYSFLGYQGTFIHDTDINLIKEKNDGLSISPFGNFNDNMKATDLKGNKYYFDLNDTETANNIIRTFKEGGNEIGSRNLDSILGYSPITSWKLSRIVTKNNKTINFEYIDFNINYSVDRVSSSLTLGMECNDDMSTTVLPIKSRTSTNNFYNINSKLISKISSQDSNIEIKFYYQEDAGLPDSVMNTSLTKIVVSNNETGHKKEFHFNYGRYDGDPRLKLQELKQIGFDNGDTKELPPYHFNYEAGALPVKRSKSQDIYGYINKASNGNNLVPWMDLGNMFYQGFMDTNSANRDLHQNEIKVGTLKEIIYPAGGKTHFFYEANVDTNNKYYGGLRVRKIENISEIGQFNIREFEYFDPIGRPLLDNLNLFIKNEGSGARSYHSSPIRQPGDKIEGYKTGFFYGRSKMIAKIDNEDYIVEYNYEDNPYNLQTYDPTLSKISYYNSDNKIVRLIEYINTSIGNRINFTWNVLADMICYYNPGRFRTIWPGYNTPGRKVDFSGNYAYLPTTVATTEFLENGSHRTPVTILKEINYDPETLLKTQEITDHRRVRTVDGSGTVTYPINDGNAPRVVVDYTYPFDGNFGFSPTFPKGIVVKQEETTTKNGQTLQTGGQAYAFDAIGNIKTIYAFNKGEGSNNSNLNYVPSHYEERTNFLFDNGKPVQVQQKQGAPTSYIWSKKDGLPLAKVEGIYRGAIDQNKRSAVENADYNGLPAALNALRSHPSVAGGMVTTFTHKPLCGVETITDAKGEKATYQYDPFGRLKTIRDNEGNILSETEYNFAQ